MGFLAAKGQALEHDGQRLLLRGFGLGGWLLPEGYMWKFHQACDRPRRMEALVERLCGREYADSFWQRYFDAYITEEDIRWIAEQGLNSVRLPINARHLEDGSAWTWIDRCIAWGKKYHVYVILDMHGAMGGQTGQNIDDCENDQPELFQNPRYQEMLIAHWRELALRYRDEEIVAGYDLLNEPLPNFFAQYNHLLLPLYRRLAEAIREIDPNHMIILEGLHWSTDFSVFEDLPEGPFDHNYMIQFHKYWSPPDRESIQGYIDWAKRLDVPLFMGEGGENNLDWYTAAFPMFERHRISWSFWSYKKMDCANSPVTFQAPEGWEKMIACAKGGSMPAKEAIGIFDAFLDSVAHAQKQESVVRALLRVAPLQVPAEHYDACKGYSSREGTAHYRMEGGVKIIFANGKGGAVRFDCNAGQPQPEDENLYVTLEKGEEVQYLFHANEKAVVELLCRGAGDVVVSVNKTMHRFAVGAEWESLTCPGEPDGGKLVVSVTCAKGTLTLEYVAVGCEAHC